MLDLETSVEQQQFVFEIVVFLAMMYRILPSVWVAWRDVWHGAFVTAVLFTVGKFLIGLYLAKAGVASGFGAAGSVVVLLAWVFYSAQIFSARRRIHLGVRASLRLSYNSSRPSPDFREVRRFTVSVVMMNT